MNKGRAASVYWRYSRGILRHHPVTVSAMAIIVLMWAVKFSPIIFFALLVLSMAVVGISGGARRKIPARDLLLYVGISVLLVVLILLWAEFGSHTSR